MSNQEKLFTNTDNHFCTKPWRLIQVQIIDKKVLTINLVKLGTR